ncbi:MAG: leucine-rich repeat domain-containing protein [Oscillospiraceae bacterium]|nr:leucine-rich repeat domain-containing protein [Oscillospiraceae bacterium]
MIFNNMDFTEEAENDKLYMAILTNDTAEIERLRADGVVLSEHIKGMLRKGGGSPAKPNKYSDDHCDFSVILDYYTPEEFVSVVRNLHAELGEPIYYTETYGMTAIIHPLPEVFRCILDCFDNRKISKKYNLGHIIGSNMVELLEIAAEHGWLRFAKMCDEYIEYAQKVNSIECAAWLIDYKKRAFDLEKEREKAGKKAERELNAAPDSVTTLKQLWSYKKHEDDSITITGYKGERTEITIPEKIGKSPVTAVGEWAFWSNDHKLSTERKNVLKSITSVKLPKTLRLIERGAFSCMSALSAVNIPDGVLSINDRAFVLCQNLPKLVIPESVTEIGKEAFVSCFRLEEINIPRGVTEIKSETFKECEALKAIEIPSSVQSIGEYAFSCCKALELSLIPL